jgi:hypothetical protein
LGKQTGEGICLKKSGYSTPSLPNMVQKTRVYAFMQNTFPEKRRVL